MPKAPAKTPAAKKAAVAADKAHGTETPAAVETAAEEPVVEEATEETATEVEEATETEQETSATEATGEPTDFDHIIDLARAVDKKFGSETPKEGTQHFMLRILTALTDSETEQFETLPPTAQEWYENSVAFANDKKDVVPPTGYEPPAKAAAAPAKKAATGKTPKEPKAPKEKKVREPKPPKEKKVRKASKTYPIRLMVCKNPSITLEQLAAALPNTGKTTLSTLRSDTLAALKAAAECGWSAPA